MSVVITDGVIVGEEIELADAERLKNIGLAYIEQCADAVCFDVAGLKRSNSITVALFLAWYRAACIAKKSIKFVNLSSDLSNIIEFSGLTSVLIEPAKPS